MRQKLGLLAAVMAILLSIYILLGMLHTVPLLGYTFFGETMLRLLTQVAVTLFLAAAWGFWEI